MNLNEYIFGYQIRCIDEPQIKCESEYHIKCLYDYQTNYLNVMSNVPF